MADNTVQLDILAIDSASNIIQGIADQFGALGALAATGIGAAAGAFDSLVKAGSSEQDVLTLFNATLANSPLKNYSAQLLEMAEAYGATTTFSKDNIISAETVLARYTELSQSVMPDTVKATLGLATAMGEDATSAATTLGKSLSDIAGGSLTMLARTRMLTKEQEDQAKAMAKSGDVAGAQEYILGILNQKTGGMASAMAGTYSGQVKILTDTLDDLWKTMGEQLLPVITPVITQFEKLAVQYGPMIADVFKNTVVPAIQSVVTWFLKLIGGQYNFNSSPIGQFLLTIYAWFVEQGPNIITQGKKIFQDVFQWFATNGPTIMSDAKAVFNAISVGVTQVLPKIIDFVSTELPKLEAWWATNGPTIISTATNLFNNIKNGIQNAITVITPFVATVLKSLSNWWTQYGPQILIIWQNLVKEWQQDGPIIIAVFGAIIAILGFLITAFMNLAGTLITVYAGWTTFWVNAQGTVLNATKNIIAWVQGVITTIGNLVTKITSIPGIPHKAAGGPASGMTLVGEEGPEVVNLPAGSYVNSNKNSRGLGGGGGATYNVVVNNPTPEPASSSIQRVLKNMSYLGMPA